MSKNDFGISQEVVEALQTDKTTSNLIKHVYNFRFWRLKRQMWRETSQGFICTISGSSD